MTNFNFKKKWAKFTQINCLLLGLWLCSFTSYAKAIIEGYVKDGHTNKPLNGASIKVQGYKYGGISDSLGHYSFEIPFGEFVLAVSAIGFSTERKLVTVNDDLKLNFNLFEDVHEMEEVLVKGKKADHNVQDVEMSTIQLSVQALKKLPVVFGETDIIKALVLQPGVTTVGEGAGGFNVRGGRVDENLILLDGAPLFNTSHLLGFFSSINPDVMQGIELYKGGIPASYGGRLSSLLTMDTKTGNDEKIKYSGGIGIISSRFNADGPLTSNRKLTFTFGSRIAYPNFMIQNFPSPTNQNSASFYDLNAKLSYKFNPKNTLSLTFYRSVDSFKFPEDTSYFWRTNIATMQYSHIFNERFSVFLKAIHTDYVFGLNGLAKYYTYSLTSKVQHQELRADALYNLTKHKIEFGSNAIFYNISPGVEAPMGDSSSINHIALQTEKSREIAAYLSDEFVISKTITLQLGLRYSMYQAIGNRQAFEYISGIPKSPETITDTISYQNGQVIKTYGGFEPRLALKIGLWQNSSLKMSYNQMRQYLHLISNTTAISPVDFWKGSDAYVPPELATQYAIGYFQNFKDNSFETSIEGFYKETKNLVEYKNGAKLYLNPSIETDLLNAIGKAYGVELSVKKNKGKFTWQMGYTYSRSWVKVLTTFPSLQVNSGNWFPSNYDRPNNFSFQGQYALGHSWQFAANFVYTTGRPATYPDGQYSLNGTPVINYSERNLDRLPDVHRLDISFTKDTRKYKEQKHYGTWNISFYNVYARKNAYSIYFKQFNTLVAPYQLSVFGTIIPSLTYNFYY